MRATTFAPMPFVRALWIRRYCSKPAESGDADAFMKRLGDAHPIGRIAQSEEIAQFFLFLASDNARFITGAVLMIDGGYTAQ